MLRILHIIGAMDRGGAESAIMNLYRNLNRDQIQFDFLVCEDRTCDFDAEIEALGGTIYRDLPRFNGANYFQCKRALKLFFAQHPHYKIVHGHIASSAFLYFPEAKRTGAICIAHSHAQNYPLSASEIASRIISHPIRHLADYFLAYSAQAGLDRFGAKVCHSDKFNILNNGIDVCNFENSPQNRNTARAALGVSDELVIGHVGRFDAIKNHTFLIDVMQEICKFQPNAKLFLLGRGAEKARVRQLVAEKGLAENVIFYGVSEDVASVMKAFDVFVFPSHKEGLAMVCVEAQAAGAPCVVSRGMPELAIVNAENVAQLPLSAGAQLWAQEAIEFSRNSAPRYTAVTTSATTAPASLALRTAPVYLS